MPTGPDAAAQAVAAAEAAKAVKLEKERHRMMGKDGVMAEDLDALADLEINLANKILLNKLYKL